MTSKRPLILITPSDHVFDTENEFRPKFELYKNYARAIYSAGGIPVICAETDLAEEYAECCAGLVVPGGKGIHPSRYGGTFKEQWVIPGATNIPRDEMEFAVFEEFYKRKKPIMGICHGFHLINVALGGSLILNFPPSVGEEHVNGCDHMVNAVPGSLVHRLFGDRFEVNSYHRNTLDRIGDGIIITSRSDKGIIESFEHETLPIYGYQWHPERARNDQQVPNPYHGPDMTPVFSDFVDRCRNAEINA